MIPRRSFHRATFLLAGIYNIGWGLFSALNPQWLFRLTGMPESNRPEIFACGFRPKAFASRMAAERVKTGARHPGILK